MKIIALIIATLITTNYSIAQTKLEIDSVGKHIGENVTVCSKVYSIKVFDKVTFINLGANFPNSPLTIVIFTKDFVNFTDTPTNMYENKKICVTGILKKYKDKTEIIVSKPTEIVLN